MQSFRLLWGSILTMLLCATLALAQTGSIQGTVTDSAGAVVSGAEITVRNLGSTPCARRPAAAPEPTASPNLSACCPTRFTVTNGSFKTFHATDVKITVAQVLSVNMELRSRPSRSAAARSMSRSLQASSRCRGARSWPGSRNRRMRWRSISASSRSSRRAY